jgi:phosphotransferase system  glucose/maltose/N-acetylglucosamine-specific IIC component
MAMASTAVMVAYALAMLWAWWRDTGSPEVGALLRSMGRGLVAAGVSALIGTALVEAMVKDLSVARSFLALILGALVVTGCFFVMTFLMRSPEWKELRRRRELTDRQE